MPQSETAQQYIDRLLGYVGDRDGWTILASTASRLRALTTARAPDVLTRKPSATAWSVAEILAHLADAEVVAAWRVRSVLAVDGVPLQPFDQNTWADAFRYESADPGLSLELFDVNRRATLALLRRVDSARHQHAGMHAERGRESITHLVRLYAGHDLNHLAQVERIVGADPAPRFTPAPVKPQVASLEGLPDIRVGTITAAAPVRGSRKLAALTVSFGDHERTIVAGLVAERADLGALVGRQALFLVNIPARTMAGVESHGMLFDLGYADGIRPALAVPEFPVPDGTRAG
jgi:tRNA-binding EMAP/Myf-like protein